MNRRAAIVTAYYRGRYAKLAASPSSSEIKGAMAAIGTDEADALEFCALEDNAGRITVAAVNAPSSVTLSGDEDAIEEAIATKASLPDDSRLIQRITLVTCRLRQDHILRPCREAVFASMKKSFLSSGLSGSRVPRLMLRP
ncbi:hypothetical protein LB505_009273 [Fusarium chuoi]|nr:hypothetical protein LB505_009273 [Fusarium chuoi]